MAVGPFTKGKCKIYYLILEADSLLLLQTSPGPTCGSSHNEHQGASLNCNCCIQFLDDLFCYSSPFDAFFLDSFGHNSVHRPFCTVGKFRLCAIDLQIKKIGQAWTPLKQLLQTEVRSTHAHRVKSSYRPMLTCNGHSRWLAGIWPLRWRRGSAAAVV